jgi:E3 ubiquitin-protein ligase HERC4
VYNVTIIDLPFPLVLYKKLLNKTKIDLEDMKSLSPSVYQSLRFLLNYKDEDLESTLCYTFEIEREIYDERRRIPLKPGGSSLMVNQKNKHEFIDLYVDYVFNRACEKQFQAFANGFRRVINSKPLELFYPDELMSFVVDTRRVLNGPFQASFVVPRSVIPTTTGASFRRKRNTKANTMPIIMSCR